MKIAEKTFPIITETAELKNSLTLNTKFPKENDEIDGYEGKYPDGYVWNSIIIKPKKQGSYTKEWLSFESMYRGGVRVDRKENYEKTQLAFMAFPCNTTKIFFSCWIGGKVEFLFGFFWEKGKEKGKVLFDKNWACYLRVSSHPQMNSHDHREWKFSNFLITRFLFLELYKGGNVEREKERIGRLCIFKNSGSFRKFS